MRQLTIKKFGAGEIRDGDPPDLPEVALRVIQNLEVDKTGQFLRLRDPYRSYSGFGSNTGASGVFDVGTVANPTADSDWVVWQLVFHDRGVAKVYRNTMFILRSKDADSDGNYTFRIYDNAVFGGDNQVDAGGNPRASKWIFVAEETARDCRALAVGGKVRFALGSDRLPRIYMPHDSFNDEVNPQINPLTDYFKKDQTPEYIINSESTSTNAFSNMVTTQRGSFWEMGESYADVLGTSYSARASYLYLFDNPYCVQGDPTYSFDDRVKISLNSSGFGAKSRFFPLEKGRYDFLISPFMDSIPRQPLAPIYSGSVTVDKDIQTKSIADDLVLQNNATYEVLNSGGGAYWFPDWWCSPVPQGNPTALDQGPTTLGNNNPVNHEHKNTFREYVNYYRGAGLFNTQIVIPNRLILVYDKVSEYETYVEYKGSRYDSLFNQFETDFQNIPGDDSFEAKVHMPPLSFGFNAAAIEQNLYFYPPIQTSAVSVFPAWPGNEEGTIAVEEITAANPYGDEADETLPYKLVLKGRVPSEAEAQAWLNAQIADYNSTHTTQVIVNPNQTFEFYAVHRRNFFTSFLPYDGNQINIDSIVYRLATEDKTFYTPYMTSQSSSIGGSVGGGPVGGAAKSLLLDLVAPLNQKVGEAISMRLSVPALRINPRITHFGVFAKYESLDGARVDDDFRLAGVLPIRGSDADYPDVYWGGDENDAFTDLSLSGYEFKKTLSYWSELYSTGEGGFRPYDHTELQITRRFGRLVFRKDRFYATLLDNDEGQEIIAYTPIAGYNSQPDIWYGPLVFNAGSGHANEDLLVWNDRLIQIQKNNLFYADLSDKPRHENAYHFMGYGVGTSYLRTIARSKNAIFFANKEGIFRFADNQPRPITEGRLQDWWQNEVNVGTKSNAIGGYFYKRNQYWLYLPGYHAGVILDGGTQESGWVRDSDTTNDMILVWDDGLVYNDPVQGFKRHKLAVAPEIFFNDRNGDFGLVDTNKKSYYWTGELEDFNISYVDSHNSQIDFQLETQDFGDREYYLIPEEIRVVRESTPEIDPNGTDLTVGNLTLEIIRNGDETDKETHTFPRTSFRPRKLSRKLYDTIRFRVSGSKKIGTDFRVPEIKQIEFKYSLRERS